MEAFESVVRLYFECKDYLVSGGVGISLNGMDRKMREEAGLKATEPTIRLDLVAANAEELIICEVKSYFGSQGVRLGSVSLEDGSSGRPIRLFTNEDFSDFVKTKLAQRYRYPKAKVKFCLAVGKFKGDGVEVEAKVGTKPGWTIISSRQIAKEILKESRGKAYIDDPIIAAMRCLDEAKLVKS